MKVRPIILSIAALALAASASGNASGNGSGSGSGNGNGNGNSNSNSNAQSTTVSAQQSALVVPADISPQPGQVVVSGAVPDEAAKALIMTRLQKIYGVGNVIDQIDVGGVAAPGNWTEHMGNLLDTPLMKVHRGQLDIDGTQVRLRGEVNDEASRQQIASEIAASLNPTYKVYNGLRVSPDSKDQGMLDNLLSRRTVEFETGSATLTPAGRALLDELAAVLPRIQSTTISIVGHTDNSGGRANNLALSQARADQVKAYLVAKGMPASRFEATGVGPDQPVASNDTAEGMARNRRIDFRAMR
jgi:OOP family OmpA-OmpF porin